MEYVSPPTNAAVLNEWSYAPAPLYAFMALMNPESYPKKKKRTKNGALKISLSNYLTQLQNTSLVLVSYHVHCAQESYCEGGCGGK